MIIFFTYPAAAYIRNPQAGGFMVLGSSGPGTGPVYVLYTWVNFINILCAHFLYKILAPKITKPNVIREKLLNLLSYEKRARKMLMKLTPDRWRDYYEELTRHQSKLFIVTSHYVLLYFVLTQHWLELKK